MDVKSFTLSSGNVVLNVKDEQARTDISDLSTVVSEIKTRIDGFDEYTLESGSTLDGVSLKSKDVLTVEFVSVSGRDDDDIPALVVYGAESRQSNYTSIFSGGVALNETKKVTLSQSFPVVIISCWPTKSGTVLTLRIKIERKEENVSIGITDRVASILKKVVCIGDSYTAGYIQIDDNHSYSQNPDWSWVYYAGLITRQNWLNYGISGATSISWQKNSGGLVQVQQVTGVQAYVVGLGINDILNRDSLGLKLGTVDDIGTTDETSFYRNMAKLVEELHTINSSAKILVNTIPATATNHAIPTSQYDVASYNVALRTIVSHYKGLGYPIHCIDLASSDNMKYYENPDVLQDYKYLHYTMIGYQMFAEIYIKILSRYILDNIRDFQDVFLIPTA